MVRTVRSCATKRKRWCASSGSSRCDTHLTTRPRIRVSSGRPGAGGARLHDHALVGVPPWSAAGRDCARRVATALALLPSGPTAQQANCACLLSPVCRQDRCERWLQACRAWHDGGRVRGLAQSRSVYRGRSRRQGPGTARPRHRPSRTPSSTCSSENKTSIRTDWQNVRVEKQPCWCQRGRPGAGGGRRKLRGRTHPGLGRSCGAGCTDSSEMA